MNDLITAAKAVIESWDNCSDRFSLGIEVDNLRAAVERAEKRDAVGFDEWWETNTVGFWKDARYIWTAAQQAERERLRQRVAEIISLVDFDDVMDVFRD